MAQVYQIVLLAARVAMVVEKRFFASSAHERTLIDVRESGQRITPDQLLRVMNGGIELETNPESVHRIIPDYQGAAPDVDYRTTLLNFFDNYREALQRVIEQKTQMDERFQAQAGVPTSEARVVFARSSLETLLNHVRDRDFAAGVPIEYEELERQLKIVANYIDQQGYNPFVGDCVVKLAIEGGGYCQAAAAPAIRQVYRDVVFQMFMRGEDLTPHQKHKLLLYQVLKTYRERLFQKILLSDENPAMRIPGYQDLLSNRHMYNALVAVYGEPFGIYGTGVEDDIFAQITLSNPQTWLMNKILNYGGIFAVNHSLEFKELLAFMFFNQEYTPEKISLYLSEAAAFEGEGPSSIIGHWMTDWINAQNFSPEDKGRMLEELTSLEQIVHIGNRSVRMTPEPLSRWFNTPENRRNAMENLQKKFFQAIALDMGILRIRDRGREREEWMQNTLLGRLGVGNPLAN